MKPHAKPPGPRLLAAAVLAGAAQGASAEPRPPEAQDPPPARSPQASADRERPLPTPVQGAWALPTASLGPEIGAEHRPGAATARRPPEPETRPSTVPEPSTTALTLLGGAALLAWRRLTRRRDPL